MVTTSWFVTAVEARNNVVKDIAVHGEISAIEREILLAVQRGDYEVDVLDNTLMTESSADPIQVFTVDAQTNTLTVLAHPFKTGDAVVVNSSGELPPPLVSTAYYYAIYTDADHIKLAQTKAHAMLGQPLSIDFSEGVTTIAVSDPGAGYLAAPGISFVGGSPSVTAQAVAMLESQGAVAAISLQTPGSGYTDIPSVTVLPVGEDAELGPCTFRCVGISILFGGTGYNLSDLITISGGMGTPAVLRVTAVDGGEVTSATLVQSGNYSILPSLSGAATTTSGNGQDCSFVLNMGISTVAVAQSGLSYVNSPIVSISGGGGAGAAVRANISGGGVSSVTVTSAGQGFSSQPNFSVTSGSGATASAVLVPTSVQSITLTNNGGASYSDIPTVSVTPVGSGAAIALVYMRAVALQLVNAGTNYLQGDQLLISGGVGSRSVQIQVLTVGAAGNIISWNITDPGSYTVLPTLQSNNTVGGSGYGASWNVSAGVDAISLNSGGSNYSAPPLVIINGGGGAGASAIAHVSGDTVSSIEITSFGAGYTSIPAVLITNGTGATAQAHLVPTTINDISIIDGGTGYAEPPQVTIIGGGGIGAVGEAVLTGDTVSQIVVTNVGSGYTSIPEVVIEGNATAAASLTPTAIQSISVISQGVNYTHSPSVTVSGLATAYAIMVPTGLSMITVDTRGANYVSTPSVVVSSGAYQIGTPVPPITTVSRSFGVANVEILDTGKGYTTAPDVVFSAPQISDGSTPIASAALGSGTGLFTISHYQASQDYFKVWKNQTPSNEMVIRPMNDQMSAVMKYFSDLGYTINRYTNPLTGNTIAWSIKW